MSFDNVLVMFNLVGRHLLSESLPLRNVRKSLISQIPMSQTVLVVKRCVRNFKQTIDFAKNLLSRSKVPDSKKVS